MKKVLLSLVALAALLITPTLAEAFERPVYGTGTAVVLTENKNVKCGGKRYGFGDTAIVIAHRTIKDATGKPKLDQFGKRQRLYQIRPVGCPKPKFVGGVPQRWLTRATGLILISESELPILIAEYLVRIGQDPNAQPRN